MIHFGMEHPVPQNVTAFEFHLVGDMTLKQFGYLATGLGVAYFSFAFLFTKSPLIALPLIIFSTLLGVAFAFLPILDQPLDHWVAAFFKAIYFPTEGIWKLKNQKEGTTENDPLFKNRLQRYLAINGAAPAPSVPSASSAIPKMTRLIQLPQKPNPIAQPPIPQVAKPTPAVPPPGLPQLVSLAEEARILQQKVVDTQKQINTLEALVKNRQIDNFSYQQKFWEASSNLQNLIQQTNTLEQQIAKDREKTEVKIVEPKKGVDTQIVLTSLPNVINGIVADRQGNYLDGVIVIIHNSQGLPVRALKTNKLGQFSGATPLPSGTYTVTLEKEGRTFDTLQLNLEGEVLQAIGIHPKKITNEK